MKGLILKHSMWRWSRVSGNPQLLTQHAAAAKKRIQKLQPKLRAYVQCGLLAAQQRERCCSGDKLASELSIDAVTGVCTLELKDGLCDSREVCGWGTGSDACEAWDGTQPPSASLRCRNQKRVAEGEQDDGADGEDHGADAMDDSRVEGQMRTDATRAAVTTAADDDGEVQEGETDETAEARLQASAAAAVAGQTVSADDGDLSVGVGDMTVTMDADYADHVVGDDGEADDDDFLESLSAADSAVEVLLGVV